MADPIDLTTLAALATIARTGSIGAAARELRVSQQAMSARVRGAERRMGTVLVHRGANGTTLTDTGLIVVGWAEPVLDAVQALRRDLALLQERRSSSLRVAASLTIAEYLLPGWLATLRRHDPAEVAVLARNSEAVVSGLRAGEHDLGFIETVELPADLPHMTIAHDDVVLVVAPDHPWARRRSVTPAEVAQTPLVLRERGSGTRASFEAALAAAGAPLAVPPALELTSTLAIRTTVRAGYAPAALSALAVADDVDAGRLVRVAGVRGQRPLSAAWPVSGLSRPARALLEAIGDHRGMPDGAVGQRAKT